MPTLKELFETLDLTYTCSPPGQQVYYSWSTTCRDRGGAAQPARQDRDTGPLLLATRRAANDCIVHSIGLLTDPADGQAYRETVKMMFERLGRKGWPTRTKDDNEKVAGILNARWQLFERGASGVKLSECHIGKMISKRRRRNPRPRRTSTEEEQDDQDREDEQYDQDLEDEQGEQDMDKPMADRRVPLSAPGGAAQPASAPGGAEQPTFSADMRSWKVENAVRATTRNLGFIGL